MLGLYEEFTPKFVKQYARLAEQIRHAVQEYKKDVRAGKFPGQEHSFE
jgi:3-methyl-2-oxobutanoate hydroxymethyltransferase